MTFRLIEALTSQEVLFPAVEAAMPTVLAYSNEGDFDPRWADNVRSTYAGRTAHISPITLGRLPRGSLLRTGHFLLEHEGRVALESVPHAMLKDPELLRQAVTQPETIADLDEECVLLARYGHGTWGHWLGEIVPIASIVERRYPGRFRYAVPQSQSPYGCVVKESLRAYGIGAGRMIVLPRGKAVRLAKAWAVTPIWSDHTPHPAAIDVMRGSVCLSAYRPGFEKVALMRRDWATRGILNGDEIERFLEARGFRITDAGGMPFVEQVRMFQSARVVFGVIGSGLTGLIYSPNGVRVIGAGPALWGERFFVALGQHRSAEWAEVRGPSQWDGKTGHLRDALFAIPMAALADAMETLSV